MAFIIFYDELNLKVPQMFDCNNDQMKFVESMLIKDKLNINGLSADIINTNKIKDSLNKVCSVSSNWVVEDRLWKSFRNQVVLTVIMGIDKNP